MRLSAYYAARSGNYLPTFWDKLSVSSLRVKKSKIHILRGGSLNSCQGNALYGQSANILRCKKWYVKLPLIFNG